MTELERLELINETRLSRIDRTCLVRHLAEVREARAAPCPRATASPWGRPSSVPKLAQRGKN